MYEILKGYIYSSKNTNQGKNYSENRFQVKPFIELNSTPCHNQYNGYHLERHS